MRGSLFSSNECYRAAHPNEGYFAKYPSPGIQLQCFRKILHWFHDGALCLPSMMVSALVQTIAERCQIPQHLFYLTLGGKVVDCGLTVREGRIDKDACLIMQGRLRGGGGGRVVIPGEW